MQLKTHERMWIAGLIDAYEGDYAPAEPTRMVNLDDLKRRLAPSPESVMREALESIRDMPTNAGVLPNEQEIARAALTVAERLESEGA